MVLTSAGVVSSESRIVAESHSENIAVNELLGWTLLLQRAICLEPGGDTHYHEAEERAGCNVAPRIPPLHIVTAPHRMNAAPITRYSDTDILLTC